MATIGYFLGTEDHGPRELLDQARRARDAGFGGLWISDHFHPWLDEQGHSPFVWSVIGALAAAVPGMPVGTAVTCPLIRLHPAIVAQAAATSAVLLDGHFTLGVGTGELLNEHVLGDDWPEPQSRLEMLEEAIGVIRQLWTGELVNHKGKYYRVREARLYTLPERAPQIFVSGFGPDAVELAARVGDGYVLTMPDAELVGRFRSCGGKGPVQGGLKVCYAPTAEQGARTFHRLWRNSLLPGQVAQELPMPAHFEQAGQLVGEDMVRSAIPVGPDPQVHVDAIQAYFDAGIDEVYVAQVGPADEFFSFFAKEVLPAFQ